MAFEIDPILVKSFKLTVELLENDDEGTEQLRSLLEETIRTKFGARKVQPIANLAYDDDPSLKRRITSVQDDVPAKKVKVNDSPSKSSSSSPVLSSESESSGGDSEDRALEILEDNSCFVCKSSNTSQRNRLVECMDCHNLYHQNCVTPPIEADVGDPRFVWYCHNCSKGTNKLSSSSTLKSTTGGSAGSTSTGSSGSSGGSNNSSGGSSLTKTSIGKSSSSGSTRSSSGSFSGVNKPFGGKFSGRLFKSGKR